MKKFTILASLGLVAAAGAASAQPGDGPRDARGAELTRQQVVDRTERRFARLDLDEDGRLTPEEARESRNRRREQRSGRNFDRLDLDRNGSIERFEFEQARAQRAERRAEHGERRGRGFMRRANRAHVVHADRLFGEQGFITREQLQDRALARFDRLDRDRNGILTVAERREAFGRHR